jgi:L-lactate dehydrogenase complex protein LldG
MYDLFKAKAEAVGSEVHRFKAKAEALHFIEGLFLKEGIRESPGSYAVWADGPFLEGVDTEALAASIPGLKFEVTRELAKNSKIGITQMEWGIADTGTLAQNANAAEQRLASSLPCTHIMLLGTGNIVADLPAFMTKMHPNQSNYLTLITGPSKTADIERVLAIGVHGPARIVILCVDELGA